MHPTYIKINAPVSNDPRDDKNQDEIIIRNSSVGSLIPAPGQQRLQNDWNGETGDGWRVATQQAGTFYGLFRVESELRKFWRGKMMRLLPTQRKGEFLCIPESFFPSSTSSSLTSCRHAIFPFTLPTIHSRIIVIHCLSSSSFSSFSSSQALSVFSVKLSPRSTWFQLNHRLYLLELNCSSFFSSRPLNLSLLRWLLKKKILQRHRRPPPPNTHVLSV